MYCYNCSLECIGYRVACRSALVVEDCNWYLSGDVGILARLAEVHNSKKVVILTVLKASHSQVLRILVSKLEIPTITDIANAPLKTYSLFRRFEIESSNLTA